MTLARSKTLAVQLADRLGHGKMFVISYPEKLLTTQFAIDKPMSIFDYAKHHSNTHDQIGLYIHLPFCEQKCKFCNFTVSTISDEEYQTQYVNKLLEDMRHFFDNYQGKINSIDIGGGTPLLLSMKNLEKLSQFLAPIQKTLPNYQAPSFSFEQTSKLATLHPEKMKALLSCLDPSKPVRTSMGIQTIHASLLQAQKRSTTLLGNQQTSLDPVTNCRQSLPPHSHISADLLFPLGTLHEFHETIQTTINMGYDSITAYDLIDCYGGGVRKAFHGLPSYSKEMYGKFYDYWYDMMRSQGYAVRYGSNNAIKQSTLNSYLASSNNKLKKDEEDEEAYLDAAAEYAVSRYYHDRISLGTQFVGFGVGASSKLPFHNHEHHQHSNNHSSSSQNIEDVWLFNPTQLPAWFAYHTPHHHRNNHNHYAKPSRREYGFAYQFPIAIWITKDIRYQLANFGCIHFTWLQKKYESYFPTITALLQYFEPEINYALTQGWMVWKSSTVSSQSSSIVMRLGVKEGQYQYLAHIRALFTMDDGSHDKTAQADKAAVGGGGGQLEQIGALYTDAEFLETVYKQRKEWEEQPYPQS